MMKSSIYTWFGYYLPFEERIKLIKEAGFDEVIISWEDEMEPYEMSRFKCAEKAQKAGLGITHAHSSFLEGYSQLWSPPSEEKERFTDIFKTWIKECGSAGIDTLVVHTSDTGLDPYKYEDGFAFFSELAEEGEKNKVKIAVENVSRPFLLHKVLDNIDSEYLGLCYDSGHDFMVPCGKGVLLDKYKDRLYAVHLQDNDLFWDRHWLPGEGEIDYTKIIPAIRQSGYDTLSLEVCAAPKFWAGKSAEEFLSAARKSVEMLDAIK